MKTNSRVERIVKELCEMEPALAQKRAELVTIVSKLMESRPIDTFDQAFARRLRTQLLQSESQSFIQSFMQSISSRWVYSLSGAAIAVVLMLPVVYVSLNPSKPGSSDLMTSLSNSQVFNARPTSAFGSLSDLAVATMARNQSGGGGGGGPAANPVSMDSKMIAPYFTPYKFVYTGDPIVVTDMAKDVYRRVKGLNTQSLASVIGPLGGNLVNIASFNNAVVRSIDIYEPIGKGYSLNINFFDGAASLSAMYENWFAPQAEYTPVRMDEIPADSELLSIASAFVSQHGIDVSAYGQPLVDSAWRVWYEQAEDKANYYFPETYSVVYPVLINGESVRDSSGNLYGLRVDVHAREKQVFGVWNLTTQQYDASPYATEQDASRIVRVAERGGFYGWWGQEAAPDAQQVSLGTPTPVLMQFFRYSSGVNEELYVPALLFPVLDAPKDSYIQSHIIVPVIKEILDAQDQNIIMPLVRDLPVATEPAMTTDPVAR